MADNLILPTSDNGGGTIVLREISHAGDTAKLPGSFIMGISGSEGAYTAAAINGDATNGIDVDVTRVTGTVTVDGSGVTQPVSGTVTANAGSGTFTVSGAVTNTVLSVVGGGTEATAQRVTIASDSTGVLSVDDNGGSLTVDGTVAATQSGTWTVQPGNTANTTAWLVTGTGGTFPVTDSGGSLTVDNAGTFQVQVSGDALTSLQLLDDVVQTDATAFTYGAGKEAVVAGVVWDDTTVSADGVARALSLTNDMELRCHDVDAITSLQLIDNAVSGAGFNITQFGGASVPIGAGLEATAVRVTLPTDGTGKVSAAQSGTWNVTNISGTVSLPTGAATAEKQPALGTAGVASSDVITIQGIASGTVVPISDGSGSITVDNAGTFATQATLQAGTAYAGKVRLTDGTTDADVRDLANSNAVNVSIVDGSGDQITSFGGGTQYTEGDTDATIVGTACMMEVAANTLQPVQGTVADGLLVNLGSNNDVTVTGTVTANIGTVGTLATAANQTTIIGHVDGLEGLLTTIDADTGNIATSVATVAGAVSGTEMQVDVLTMPTVTVTGTVTATISAGETTIAKAEDSAHAGGDTGVYVLAVRSDTAASTATTDGDYTSLITDSTGKLHVNVGNTVTVASHAVTNAGVFACQLDGTALTRLTDIETNTDSGAVVGNGAAATAQRVTLANDSTGIVALTTSTASIGKLAANSGVDIGDVDVLSIAAGSNLIGDVSLQPRTTGGLTMHKTTSAASTNATSVKASAGQVYAMQCFNVNAAVRYVKLYNKASAPTVGTDTPVKTLAIPGNTAGAGFVIGWPQGLAFGTGIAFALTTEATDAGTTAVAANEITVNIDYK